MSLQQRRGNLISYALGILSMVLLVSVVDRQSPPVLAEAIRDADQRKELRPEVLSEIGYWRRNERNQAACRGQTWVSQCCDSSMDAEEVTCLNYTKDIR